MNRGTAEARGLREDALPAREMAQGVQLQECTIPGVCASCVHLQRDENEYPCSDCAHLHHLSEGITSKYEPRNAGQVKS